MRIIIVTSQCCGRVIKQARALRRLGYELHLITNRIPANRGIFDSKTYYHDKKDLNTTLKLFLDSDIFHVHN